MEQWSYFGKVIVFMALKRGQSCERWQS